MRPIHLTPMHLSAHPCLLGIGAAPVGRVKLMEGLRVASPTSMVSAREEVEGTHGKRVILVYSYYSSCSSLGLLISFLFIFPR